MIEEKNQKIKYNSYIKNEKKKNIILIFNNFTSFCLITQTLI